MAFTDWTITDRQRDGTPIAYVRPGFLLQVICGWGTIRPWRIADAKGNHLTGRGKRVIAYATAQAAIAGAERLSRETAPA